MSDFVVDPIEMAKTFQWEIDLVEDPVEAAIMGQEACLTLRDCVDERLKMGRSILITTMGAYMLRQWDEEEQRHITMQYTQVLASGNAVGTFGFIQNLGKPHLQTLFLPIKSANVSPFHEQESELDDTPLRPLNGVPIPYLVIPVDDIQTVKIAA